MANGMHVLAALVAGLCVLHAFWSVYNIARIRKTMRAGLRADATPAERAAMDMHRAGMLNAVAGLLLALAIPMPVMMSVIDTSDRVQWTILAFDITLLVASFLLSIPYRRLVRGARPLLAPRGVDERR